MEKSNWLKKICHDKFKRYFLIILVIIGLLLIFRQQDTALKQENNLEVHFFFHPSCPHCKEQKPLNEELIKKYPSIKWVYHDITDSKEAVLLQQYASKYQIPSSNLGVPLTFIGQTYFIGFNSKETTGKDIENALISYLSNQKTETKAIEQVKTLDVPIFGKINIFDYSLPVLAVILGLVDGFNPCAMWVLVYLISLILSINDRKKIKIIVGAFVLSSAILYFLFMTAWLNVFLWFGYIRTLTIIIGLYALWIGVNDLREFFAAKALACEVTDKKSKKKTMSKMERIVFSPLTLWTILGIIALAFVVNSFEFVCSSAIPAVFTQVLAVSHLTTAQYYSYILLYVFFFMLDDLIIFSLAAFAVTSTSIGTKYARYCKLIGGIILAILGLILVFAPGLLR